MKLYTFFLFSFLMINIDLFAQFEGKYSHYTLNQLMINPAIAGNQKNMINTLSYRSQWGNNIANLQQKNFTTHLPFNQQRMGIGLIFIDESSRFQQYSQASLNLSYKINIFQGLLAFGIESGFLQYKVDFSKLDIKDLDDKSIQNINNTEGDFSTGIFYQKKSLYVGFSIKHLAFSSLKNHFYFHCIYTYKVSHNFEIIPSVLIKYNNAWATGQLDINAHFKFHKQFWLGISYQTSQEISLQSGIAIHKINKKISRPIILAYNFDYGFSGIYSSNSGSNEIVCKIHINPNPKPSHILNKKRYVSPLFF